MTTLTPFTDKIVANNKIMISVSLLEAALIKSIRKYDFGEFRIIKMNGEPRRIIKVEGSVLLKEKDGLELAIDKDKR